ncbi:MAG: hypothetical protein ABI231_12555 [Candidatus Tumulicola sp.]
MNGQDLGGTAQPVRTGSVADINPLPPHPDLPYERIRSVSDPSIENGRRQRFVAALAPVEPATISQEQQRARKSERRLVFDAGEARHQRAGFLMKINASMIAAFNTSQTRTSR